MLIILLNVDSFRNRREAEGRIFCSGIQYIYKLRRYPIANGGICLFFAFLCLAILGPLVPAGAFLLNRRSLPHPAAGFLMASVMVVAAGSALAFGRQTFQTAGDMGAFSAWFALGANLCLAAGAAVWGVRSGDRIPAVFSLLQCGLLGWLAWKAGAAAGPVSFVLDHLSGLVLLLTDGAGALISVEAYRRARDASGEGLPRRTGPGVSFAALCLLTAALNGLVLANHLLWQLLFLQTAAAAAGLLLAHGREAGSRRTARHYAAVCSFGAAAFAAGICLLYAAGGTLTVGELLRGRDAAHVLAPVACLVAASIAFAFQFPFQGPLLRCSTTAAPVSAMLQSAALPTAAVYLLLRLSPLLMNTWTGRMVAVAGAFSFAAGALLAAMRHDDRRFLALTTVSCTGLVIALSCFASVQAIFSAVLLLFTHSLQKASLLLADTAGRSRTPMQSLLAVTGGILMLAPPFTVAAAQWTALESAVRNPAALFLLAAGCVFWLAGWSRFLGRHISGASLDGAARALPVHAPQTLLLLAAVSVSLFAVPIVNRWVKPILKENFGRFGDVAQSGPGAFLLKDFSGIDPLPVAAVLAVLLLAGRLALRRQAVREDVSPEVPAEEETTAAGQDSPASPVPEPVCEPDQETAHESAADLQQQPGMPEPPKLTECADEPVERAPQRFEGRPAFAGFPDARRIQRYASLLAAALLILMLEVVFR